MKEPVYAEQLDEFNNPETIDTSIYSELIICSNDGCSNMRYIKRQDTKQTKMCKPCTRRLRLAARALRAQTYRKRDKNIPE